MTIRMIGKISVFLFLIVFSSYSHAETKVIAHRGNSSQAPENTLAAVQSALDLNPQPDYIEIDLHRSKDGVLVVCHDFSLERTTGESGYIRDLTFEEIRKRDAGFAKKFQDRFAGEKLPRLDEVLDLVKDEPVGIMIECKQLLLEDQVIDLLRKRKELDKHVLASFDEITIYQAKKIEPKLKTLYLTGSLDQVSIWRAKELNADIIGAHQDGAAPWISDAKQAGFDVWIWTVDKEDIMKTLIQSGADGIISNVPARVQAVLQRRKK